MAGAESFTVLAILEARDAASEIFAKVDESLGKFSETAKGAANSARDAGVAIDDALGRDVDVSDRLETATARLSAAQAKGAEAARALTVLRRRPPGPGVTPPAFLRQAPASLAVVAPP
jgi:hypothetical protein